MNEREWRERYAPLARERLPEEARKRVHRALQSQSSQPAGPKPARGSLSRGAWWAAAGAVAAGLVALAVYGHRPQANGPAHPKKKTTAVIPGAHAPLLQVDMVSAASGWAVTQKGQVLHTSDGGRSWVAVTPAGIPRGAGIGLGATDAMHAWVALGSSTSNTPSRVVVYRTGDGGRTWQRVATNVRGWSPQVRFLSSSVGNILVNEGAAAGSEGVVLLGTANGGASWTIVANGQPTAQNPPKIFGGDKSGFGFVDSRHGWITGNWAADSILLYHTTDGGKTWSNQNLPLPQGLTAQGGSAQSESPFFFGTRNGVLPVEFFHPGEPIVFYRTTDGGGSWTPTTPVNGGSNQPVYSVVSLEVIYVSDGSKVYRSSDGGVDWTSIQPTVQGIGSLQGVRQLDFTSASDGFAVVDGQLLHTTDGGRTWTKQGQLTGS